MAEPSGIAQELVDSPLLNELFDKLERTAMERGISAALKDDELRLIAATQVKAIRLVREELQSLASGKAKPYEADAVA